MLSGLLLFAGAYAQTLDVTSPTHHGRGVIVFDAAATIAHSTPESPVVKVDTSTCLAASVDSSAESSGYAAAVTSALLACNTECDDAGTLNGTEATGLHYSQTTAAAGISLPVTEVKVLVLVDCANTTSLAANVSGALTFSVQYSYAIEKHDTSSDKWDDVDKNDHIHFKGLKASTGWMCFLSDTGEFDTNPDCGAVGVETELNSDARVRDGDAAQCTAVADADGRTKLKVKNTGQDHLRVRHCLYAGDTTSPVVALSFTSGTSDLTLIGFWVFAVLATLAFILAVAAYVNRTSGGNASEPFKTLYKVAGGGGHGIIFIIIVAGFGGAASYLAHEQWGNHTEFYAVVSVASVFVVILAWMMFRESRGKSLLPRGYSTAVAEAGAEFLPHWDSGHARPMRAMSLR